MAMPAGAIIERLDVIEDVRPGQIPSLTDPFLDAFIFQARTDHTPVSVAIRSRARGFRLPLLRPFAQRSQRASAR